MPRSQSKPALVSSEQFGSTATKLLDAAEQLFADFGFNGIATRDIVEKAGINLGAIPYHFGTKENLFKEVIRRRAVPLRDERNRLLQLLYDRKTKPTMEEVLTALLKPAFRSSHDNDAFRRLLGRASTDPAPEVRKLLGEIYTKEFMTVPKQLRKMLPKLPDEEFFWKLNCFYGVMLFVQADTGKIQTIAGPQFNTSNPETALKYVIPFLAAGFYAKI
jgi:AcrR family transcriptional regulator